MKPRRSKQDQLTPRQHFAILWDRYLARVPEASELDKEWQRARLLKLCGLADAKGKREGGR